MRNLIAALGALLLAALGFLPGGLPTGAGPWRDGALVVLIVFLAWQAIFALRGRQPASPPAVQPPAPPPAPAPAPRPPAAGGEALVLLSLLQEKGRFLDFVAEDITAYSDAQVAAASRVVHQGCAAVVRECLTLAPTHPGAEGDRVVLTAEEDVGGVRVGVVVQRGDVYRHPRGGIACG